MSKEIPELLGEKGKFRYLFDEALPRAVAKRISQKDVTSFPTLAKAVDQKSHSEFVENKIGQPNRARLRDLYGMPQDSECWGEFCAGSRDDFVAEFEKLHAQFHMPEIGNHNSDFKFHVVRAGRWSIHRTISVELMFSANRQGADWPFDVDIVCQRADIAEINQSIIVTRATLVVRWDTGSYPQLAASRIQERQRLIEALGDVLASNGLEVLPYGPVTSPEWEISRPNGERLGILPLSEICRLVGVADGVEVEARLIVYDKDLRAEDSASSVGIEDDTAPIRRIDGTPFGETSSQGAASDRDPLAERGCKTRP